MSETVGSPLVFTWLPNEEADLSGYKVYAGRATGTYDTPGYPIDVGNFTYYEITVNEPGTWFFAVTAYNTADEESGFSSELEVQFETLKFICA